MEPNEYVDFNYTGNIQTFTVPNTGYYKLEVYGAEGGRGGWYFSRHWCDGGKGGHAVGYKRLRKGTVLYIGVGGRGNDISGGYGSGWLWTSTPGGYNGGGTGYAQDTGAYDTETQEHTWRGINSGAGSGGGATHIAYNQSALLKDTNQNNVLIAAGGGGGGWIGSAGWGSDYGPFSSGGGAGGNNASGAYGQGSSYGYQQDAYANTISGITIGGGGGGGWNGGGASIRSGGGGGSNYIDHVDDIKIGGQTLTRVSEAGKRSGHGTARITLLRSSLVENGNIFFGTKEIEAVYFRDKEIESVSTIDWDIISGKAISLGTGKTFTVNASIYEDYKNLNIDDFFITPTEGILYSTSYMCPGWDGDSCNDSCMDFSDSIYFSKSWNPDTGVFTCSFANRDVTAWIIPNSQKLINNGRIKEIGTGESFNVKNSIDDYANCTKNNFLCRTLNYYESKYVCCSPGCPNGFSFEKSYDASTGQLVMHTTRVRGLGGGTPNTTPFYIPNSFLRS